MVLDSKDKSESQTVSIPITIQSDTDKDGNPDVTDTDDDTMESQMIWKKKRIRSKESKLNSSTINLMDKEIINGEQTVIKDTNKKIHHWATENPDAKL